MSYACLKNLFFFLFYTHTHIYIYIYIYIYILNRNDNIRVFIEGVREKCIFWDFRSKMLLIKMRSFDEFLSFFKPIYSLIVKLNCARIWNEVTSHKTQSRISRETRWDVNSGFILNSCTNNWFFVLFVCFLFFFNKVKLPFRINNFKKYVW